MIINIIRTFSREIRAITDINLFHNIYKHFFDKTTENEHIVNKIINCENNQETLINLIHLMNKNVDRCIIVFGCESPEAYGKTVVWQKVSNWCIINKFLFLFRTRLYHNCVFHNLWAMSACVLGCGKKKSFNEHSLFCWCRQQCHYDIKKTTWCNPWVPWAKFNLTFQETFLGEKY